MNRVNNLALLHLRKIRIQTETYLKVNEKIWKDILDLIARKGQNFSDGKETYFHYLDIYCTFFTNEGFFSQQ